MAIKLLRKFNIIQSHNKLILDTFEFKKKKRNKAIKN
jgi:hypothetical protein